MILIGLAAGLVGIASVVGYVALIVWAIVHTPVLGAAMAVATVAVGRWIVTGPGPRRLRARH